MNTLTPVTLAQIREAQRQAPLSEATRALQRQYDAQEDAARRAQQRRLVCFALRTLQTLEAHKEWNETTVEAIYDHAASLGLENKHTETPYFTIADDIRTYL